MEFKYTAKKSCSLGPAQNKKSINIAYFVRINFSPVRFEKASIYELISYTAWKAGISWQAKLVLKMVLLISSFNSVSHFTQFRPLKKFSYSTAAQFCS